MWDFVAVDRCETSSGTKAAVENRGQHIAVPGRSRGNGYVHQQERWSTSDQGDSDASSAGSRHNSPHLNVKWLGSPGAAAAGLDILVPVTVVLFKWGICAAFSVFPMQQEVHSG